MAEIHFISNQSFRSNSFACLKTQDLGVPLFQFRDSLSNLCANCLDA